MKFVFHNYYLYFCLMESISNNIRQLRTALGYSQEFVAKKLKMTQQSYSSLENNPERASLQQLKQLAEILKVSLMALLGEENQLNQTNINQQGGQAAAQMNLTYQTDGKDKVYQEYIDNLKAQVDYLKSLITK